MFCQHVCALVHWGWIELSLVSDAWMDKCVGYGCALVYTHFVEPESSAQVTRHTLDWMLFLDFALVVFSSPTMWCASSSMRSTSFKQDDDKNDFFRTIPRIYVLFVNASQPCTFVLSVESHVVFRESANRLVTPHSSSSTRKVYIFGGQEISVLHR